MHAIIDIGSNTIRLAVYKVEKGKLVSLLHQKESVGLAGYVQNGQMQPEGIEKTCEVLQGFHFLLSHFQIENICAFATAALRNISNSQEAIASIQRRTGLPITVLTGDEEAELGFVGATSVMDLQEGLLIDIGGASTELVIYQEKKVRATFSMPLGCLNVYNQYVTHLFPDRRESKLIRQVVLRELERERQFYDGQFSVICGIGGTIRAAGKLNNYLGKFSSANAEIKVPNINKMINLLVNDEADHLLSGEALDLLLQVVPERVRTILPGLIILDTLVAHFQSDVIFVSTSGVREGFLYDRVIGRKDGEYGSD